MINKLNTSKGQAIYSKLMLMVYNIIVLRISNKFAWKCVTSNQLMFFNQHITSNHLDVGVGTGYYIDNCNFPQDVTPKLTLVDLNQNCLDWCAKKLYRYNPICYKKDLYDNLDLPDKYSSISINYVLHCLPGTLNDKERVLLNLKNYLTRDGVIFGSTILGKDSQPNFFAKRLLNLYNKKGVFSNLSDDEKTLKMILSNNFSHVSTKKIGMVMLFCVS